MSLEEIILKEVQSLPKEKQAEVIDFIGYLKAKELKEDEEIINQIITENAEALTELAKQELIDLGMEVAQGLRDKKEVIVWIKKHLA